MNKIYVGNLPQQTTEDALRSAFSAHGEIKSIQLPIDRTTGAFRGFGFVQFATQKEAETALAELNGKLFLGNKIKVSIAQERRSTGGGMGAGGGHRSGGGGAGSDRRRW